MTELQALRPPLAIPSGWPRRLLHAGLLCGVVDLLWAIVLTMAYGRSLAGLFQGIAATAFGPGMREAGWGSIALGFAMHFFVAFWWSGVFLGLVRAMPALRRALDSRVGMLAVAGVYGPFVWIVMSRVVIPLLIGRPVAISGRWWIQLGGHALFVGLPIVWAIGRPATRRSGAPGAARR